MGQGDGVETSWKLGGGQCEEQHSRAVGAGVSERPILGCGPVGAEGLS